jgi:hypothetical protein
MASRIGLLVALALSAPAVARADDLAKEPLQRFGATGQMLVTSEARLDLSVSTRTYDDDAGNPVHDTEWDFGVRFAVDRVMRAPFTVGLVLGVDGDEGIDGGYERVIAGARAGWLVTLSAHHAVTLWPRAGLSAGLVSQHAGGAAVSDTTLRFDVSCPLMWNAVRHLVMGIGPFVDTDLAHATTEDGVGRRTVTYGLRAVIGGWWR